MIPAILCSILLASSGVNIIFDDYQTVTTTTSTFDAIQGESIVVLNSTSTSTESLDNHVITLQNPVWVVLHYMIAIVLMLFVITRLLQMLMFSD